MAIVTAWVRSAAPSLSRMFWTCILTVPLAVPSRSAISLLPSPSRHQLEHLGFARRQRDLREIFAETLGDVRRHQAPAGVHRADGVHARRRGPFPSAGSRARRPRARGRCPDRRRSSSARGRARPETRRGSLWWSRCRRARASADPSARRPAGARGIARTASRPLSRFADQHDVRFVGEDRGDALADQRMIVDAQHANHGPRRPYHLGIDASPVTAVPASRRGLEI